MSSLQYVLWQEALAVNSPHQFSQRARPDHAASCSVLALRALDQAGLHPLAVVKAREKSLHLGVDLVVLGLRGAGAAGVDPDARESGVVVAPVVDGVARVIGVDHSHVGTVHVGLRVHNLALAVRLAGAWGVKADARGHTATEKNSLERVVDGEVLAIDRVVV